MRSVNKLAAAILLFSVVAWADDFPWIAAAERPDKIILRIEDLPSYYSFEFWFGSESVVLTKDKLIEALQSITTTSITATTIGNHAVMTEQDHAVVADRPCVIAKNTGVIKNYPCVVKSPSPRKPTNGNHR